MSIPSSFSPKRLLITRLSAIGDCVLTIPLAVAAKQMWPNCEIVWVVECAAEQFLQSHPAIDQVVRIPKGWLGRPRQWLEIRRQMRGLQCDLVLDPQGLSKSALLGWLSGAKYRIGFDSSHAREIAPWMATQRVSRSKSHMVDTYMQMLEPWGGVQQAPQFQMPSYKEAAQSAREILAGCNLTGNWIGLNPGAGWTTRIWPTERFAELASALFQRYGMKSLVFWGGEAELEMAEQIVTGSGNAAVIAPSTSLVEMLELMRCCTLFVTGDTGPLHFASSLGLPCVSLHGATWAEESGPFGNPHIAIQSKATPQEKKFVRKGPNAAMQAIPTREVIIACSELLGEQTSASTNEGNGPFATQQRAG
ncbi:MAG: glycosyltransferase family 9 protein [Planctomycetota bacterium]